MKKIIALFAIVSLGFVACNNAAETKEGAEEAVENAEAEAESLLEQATEEVEEVAEEATEVVEEAAAH